MLSQRKEEQHKGTAGGEETAADSMKQENDPAKDCVQQPEALMAIWFSPERQRTGLMQERIVDDMTGPVPVFRYRFFVKGD